MGAEMVAGGGRLDAAVVCRAPSAGKGLTSRRMRYQIWIPVMLLQIVNIFWYFSILRVAYR